MTVSQNENSEAKGAVREKAPYHFGEKLRSVRERKGYTLKVVAQRAGVSESLVSQIERNRVSPAIDTLLALAEVLDINLEFLFEEYRKKHPVEIIHPDERRGVDEDGVRYEEIVHPNSEDGSHTMESYLVTIPPHSQTHKGSYGHIGRETGYVLSGEGELHYEQNVYHIKAGDGISFSAGAPHVLVNNGDQELKAVWTVTPSQRFNKQD
ncbi:MAG: helix-turn-helix transcriptional regulator [Treponema sp.]|nr:helix-turn-helix transcriptional regulator [Treponema sp.]